jgi:hypothetical protein
MALRTFEPHWVSILYIPMIDFTDFKSGTIINTDSHLETAQYQGRFIYEKDGVKQILTNKKQGEDFTLLDTEYMVLEI